MSRFARISDIDLSDERSWKGRIFLTLDIDWAEDFVLADTIALLERAAVPATWFATHPTPMLERIRANPLFEIGVHPNFNPLLFSGASGDAGTVVRDVLALAPGCRAVRSHSVAQSTGILAAFSREGLTYDCNMLIPWDAGMTLRPWRYWEAGMVRVPYLWEDDVACLYGWPLDDDTDYWYQPEGINVLDFHPIHLYLNSVSLDRYEMSRADHRNETRLCGFRHDGAGTRTFLQKLLTRHL
ncbi:hypothetical protein ABE612_01140 [Achromobacter xylosoxidans]|uniref:polysaccharide deacetylase WbmS family protein n=1 Tax=Achromobacter TaxID=222 RepID=UPI001564C65D|nr:hypothetical protein [Achromobacter xylosoxidans]QKI70419.1 hypothetical protein HPS44_12690 [Achromobacter xylosoxidans]